MYLNLVDPIVEKLAAFGGIQARIGGKAFYASQRSTYLSYECRASHPKIQGMRVDGLFEEDEEEEKEKKKEVMDVL
ncbi:unnamed protein product [Dibothriocephalus latus]|uniref:Uncharacterized protein n=1 Tax=Dibothriocephalus latus TaxID=60516 RepID=A0A3P7MK66_DIBLA|nr:unnamed protein product [Dibothriocephalus latus]